MTLFHYTSGRGLFGIITSSQLHCSHQKFLNDPTEHSYFEDVLHTVLDNNQDLKTIFVELFETNHQTYSNSIQQFIFSFSKNPDSLSMWNYYANGNGYNIGFDINSILKRNKNHKSRIKKVEMIYDFSIQKEMIKKFVEKCKDDFKIYNNLNSKMINSASATEVEKCEEEQHEIKKRFSQGINALKISFKHQAYKDEEEIRLIIDQGDHAQFKVSAQGVFVEYLILDIFPKQDIKQIMVHPLSTILHEEGMKRFIKSYLDSKVIKVHRSKIPFRLI